MRTSIRDIFRVGIGPSSSHTVGPMRAARDFVATLQHNGVLREIVAIQAELYGSLALTGPGHGTGKAVILGLLGEAPESIDPDQIDVKLHRVRESGRIEFAGGGIAFEESNDLIWRNTTLPGHPNAIRFVARTPDGTAICEQVYYSTGGGFIRKEGEAEPALGLGHVPYPYSNARQMLAMAKAADLPLWSLIEQNELAACNESDLHRAIDAIWWAMRCSIERGLATEGVLPGGLHVRRRASTLAKRLRATDSSDPMQVVDWINAFAMAVNEENAVGGRVVTAPTNGAAGVVPAVASYYDRFVSAACRAGIYRYFLVAGAVGALYKDNASISGAEVGCQGEVGVACSMAAAGLVAALSGTAEQIEHAAEIGMEHHLGMTCDPVRGLVQIPCIERNAIAAVKAVNAARLALQGAGEHKVSLDEVMKTMLETGRDMQARYKETSLGGLAVNVANGLGL